MSENDYGPQGAAPGKDIEAWLRIVLADERQKHLREVMELKFEAQAATNEIAKIELARRLDILNHEAERLNQMQQTYLRADMYGQERKSIEERVNDLRDWKNNVQGRLTIIAFVVSVTVSAMFLLLNWVLTKR